jgi:Holliday junction resolvase RusA-like endonuclease
MPRPPAPAGRPYTQVLVIEDFPDTTLARQLSPNGRVHWRVKDNARKRAAERIATECTRQGMQAWDFRVRLTMRWVFPQRGRHDPDNLIATAKAVIDALVRKRLISDDSSEHLEIAPPEVVVERRRRALEITLEALT